MLASALAGACATFPRAPDEGGSPWISVATPHFTLATDMEEKPAETLARMLEDAWTAMEYALESLPGGALEEDTAAEPVLVLALKNDREREAVHNQLGGLYSAKTLLPPAVSIGDIDTNRGEEVLKHELAHALLAKRLPRVPRWLNEGIAVYLQNAELDRKRDTVEWGVWNANDSMKLMEYNARVSVDSVFDSERWKSNRDTWALELESGLLVHMLVNRHPDQLACYLKRLATDLDAQAAMECFPGRKRWTHDLNDYDYEGASARKQASVTYPTFEMSTVVMRNARVHAVLAFLDYMVAPTIAQQFRDARLQRAQGHLARALEIDPDDPLAIVLTLAETAVDGARQAELSKRLVDRHPGHWASWVARAGAPGLTGDEQMAAIDRAWELAPGRAEVLALAAWRAFADARWSEARTLAIKAWFGGIDGDDNRALVYAAAVQIGSCKEADAWLPSTDRKGFIARVARLREETKAPPGLCPAP